jgi:deferrochelatase/peroxidase EfeB
MGRASVIATPAAPAQVDYEDIQGIVRFGYGKMTQAAYLLARIKDAAAARAWLRRAPISTAATLSPPPTTALQVAFTAPGLAALDVESSIIDQFSHEFRGGMTDPNRVRRSGDVARNAPASWEWGWDAGEASAKVPHVAFMLFAEPTAENGGGLEAFAKRVIDAEWSNAFELQRRLETNDIGGIEPFGFADGISQPTIDWEQRRNPTATHIDYENLIALGEVLLGYRNEYGKYTDRPLVDDNARASDTLLPAVDAPQKKDVGRNGTYLVMRQLEQDVRTFWQYVNAQASAANDPTVVDRLSSAFVGRSRDGTPLVNLQDAPIEGVATDPKTVRQNQFTFDDDPAGARCPFGSHIRRVNPRNSDYPGHPTGVKKLLAMLGLTRREFRDDLTSSVRFHRIVRRGREYGPALSPTDALQPAAPDDPPRGLHFICLNANISRQFEFLQNAWVMSTKFSGLTGASDPLLGNRVPIAGCPATDGFVIESDGAAGRRVSGLPQFITVRGGAYFFLPSLRAIRFFAAD